MVASIVLNVLNTKRIMEFDCVERFFVKIASPIVISIVSCLIYILIESVFFNSSIMYKFAIVVLELGNLIIFFLLNGFKIVFYGIKNELNTLINLGLVMIFLFPIMMIVSLVVFIYYALFKSKKTIINSSIKVTEEEICDNFINI